MIEISEAVAAAACTEDAECMIAVMLPSARDHGQVDVNFPNSATPQRV